MDFTALIFLAVLAALAWYVMDGLRAREAGVSAARRACARDGLQFLDDSVALRSQRFMRNEEGRLLLQRVYAFEYSDTGDNRLPGTVTVLGRQVTALDIAWRGAEATLH
ncbi:MAG: DUF3301 domain-containing protein [Moraxellaceae bacterium]|nr:DUF3301 domain-containing protein [Moraxellaceae bacterium]